MDEERKVADVFRAAVADAPPASFDARDVAERSRRIAARRRKQLITGSTAAVVVLGVGVLIGAGPYGSPGQTSGASAGSVVHGTGPSTFGRNAVPAPAGPGAGTAHLLPSTPPKQGGGADGKAGPDAGSAPGGCGPTDRELGVALANELPSVGARLDTAATVPPITLTCPAGAKSVALAVRDGSVSGTLIAVLTPPAAPTTGFLPPRGTLQVSTTTGGGLGLTVLSVPATGTPPAPLTGHIDVVADAIAPGF